jgi:hypothetical protein
MAQYRIATPQGSAVVEAPEGATKAEVIELYNRTMAYDGTKTARQESAATRGYLDAQAEQARQTALSREAGVLDYLGEVPKGLIGGAANLVEQGAVGLAALLPEGAEDVVRGGIKAVGGAVQDYVSPDIGIGDSVPRKLSEAVGSFAGLAGVSLLNPFAGAGLAVASGSGEASERARAAGATEDERSLAALAGIVPGALELLPIGFLKVLGKDGVRSILNTTARVLSEGGVEAAQEATTGLIQNLIAQGIYKPDQKLIEGVGEQAAYGGAVGAIVQGLIELATPRTRGGASAVDAGPQGELFPGEDLGRAPQRQEPTPDQAEMFPTEDLGQAPEGPDPRQGDLFAAPEETLARRAKELEREKEAVMRRPMGKAIAEFEAKDDKFFERNKRERDAARAGIASLEAAKRRPETTTRDMRDMVAESQDQVADEQARDREGLAAAERGDVAAFEQPDLFAQELESEQRRLGPKELRDPEQYMDATLFEETETPEFVRPAAERDLVDLINQDKAREDNAAVRSGKLAAQEADLAGRTQDQTRLKAESAAETAQGTIEARRTAQTTATRTKVLQDTIANAGEIRKPDALRKLYETALTGAGVANAKATPQEMESLRRASSVIRATDPALDAVAAQETVKDPGQLDMEARVAPRDRKSKPLATVITADMLPQPLGKGRPDAASGTERATPIEGGRGASAEGAIQGGAEASAVGANAGQDTQETTTPDAGRVGQPVSSTADAPAGTVAQPSTLEPTPVKLKQVKAAQYDRANPNDTASYVVEGNPDISVEKLGANWAAVNKKTKERVATAPNLKELRTKLASKLAPVKADVTPTTKQVTLEPTYPAFKKEAVDQAAKQNDKSREILVDMPIDDFLAAAKQEKSPKKLAAVKDLLSKGIPFETVPSLQFANNGDGTAKVVGHDGRHRAMALKERGETTIPVRLTSNAGNGGKGDAIRWGQQNDPQSPDYVATLPQTLIAEDSDAKVAMPAKAKDIRKTPTTKQTTQKAKPTPGAAKATSPSVKQNTQKAKPTPGPAKSKPEDKPVATKTNVDLVVEAVAEYRKITRIKAPTGAQAAAFVSQLKALGIDNPPAFLANLQKRKEQEQLKLPADLTLEFPVDTSVSAAVESGDLKGALEALATTAPDAKVQRIAKKLASNVGNTQLVTKKNLKADDGSAVAGYFDPETNTIFLDAETGISTHPILHEVLHAVTSATVANKSHPLTKRLTKIFEGVQEQLAGEYGLTSLDEFVAEAMSNPEFQTQLKTTTVNGRNPWQQLVRAVSNYVRRMLGLETKPEGSTLDAVDEIVQAMIAPTFDGRIATKMYMQIKTPAGAAKVINDLAAKTINATKGKDFYDYVQEGRSFLGGNIPPLAKKLWLNLQPVNILGELAESRIPGARQLNTIINNMSAALRKRNESLDPIVGDLKAFRRKSPDKFKTLQALVPNASAERIDPREADFDKAYGRDKSDKEQVKIAREIHKEFRKQYDSLGKEGQDLYKVVTNTFEAALNDVMKSVDANLEANGVDAGMRKKALDKIAKLLDMERGVIKPFSPLTRAGTHRLKFATIDPKTDKIEVFVERYKTRGQREEAKKQLKEYNDKWLAKLPANDPRIAGIKEEWEEGTSSSVINFDNAPKGSFVYDTLRILEAEGVDKDTQHRIVDLALDSMPERSFMQSMRQRKDVRGFKGDITPTAGAGDKRFFGLLDDSFDLVDMVQTKGRDYNRQLVQMEYGAKLQKFKNEILNTIDSNKSDEITMLYRDRMELIANFAQRPNIPRWSQSLNAGGYAWTMGWNLSSAAITTFDVFMSTAPRLMGKYGDGATAKALGSAAVILRRSPKFKMVSVMGPDGKMTDRKVNTGLAGFSIGNYDFTDANLPSEVKDLEVLVGVASENAQINQSLNQEELDMNNAKDLLEKVNSWTSFLFHHAERYNREVAMTATYMLELGRMKAAKGSALTAAEKKAAAELAVRETEFTLGATASAGRPVVSQNAIGNVAMLFKRFAISKYHMMATMTNDAFQAGGDAQTKENRRIAQHQLGRFLVSTGLFAGVAGMPLMGALGQIYDFFVDDDEDDFDAMLRKTIGEGLYGGIINTVLGVEVASRISLNSLLYRPPIIDKDQAGMWTLLEQLGGPIIGIYLSMDRGYDQFSEGEMLKGIEAISPAAVRNVLKGGKQFFTGEVATRRGDAVVEDIGLGQILGQLAGFANADVIRQYDINKNERRKDTYLTTTRTRLLRAANIAAAERDTDGYKDVMKRIREYNKDLPRTSRSKLIILPDTIKKSRTAFNTRTSNMIGGIEYTPQMRQSLKEYDQGIQLFD